MSLRKTGWNHYSKQGLLSAICENNTNRKTYLSVEYGDEIKSLETCSNWVGIIFIQPLRERPRCSLSKHRGACRRRRT